ncbi:hypothetical protein B0H13DRAFT_1901772 [Mycena leptocephala]|nr:hypothetical protein B0H13DRAFT_1901772 [Mycena leptocephala]
MAFLRAVLHHDFKEHRIPIYRELTTRWVDDPNANFLTILDYRYPGVILSVRGITLTEPSELDPGSHWPDMIDRAFTSGGRMSLHVVVLPDEGSLIIPLRKTTSEVYDRLKVIAAGMKSTDPLLIHEYVEFVKPDVTSEIHQWTSI